jgi:hypothetical protein
MAEKVVSGQLKADLLERFERYQDLHGYNNSEAVRELIRAGLERENIDIPPFRRILIFAPARMAVGALLFALYVAAAAVGVFFAGGGILAAVFGSSAGPNPLMWFGLAGAIMVGAVAVFGLPAIYVIRLAGRKARARILDETDPGEPAAVPKGKTV